MNHGSSSRERGERKTIQNQETTGIAIGGNDENGVGVLGEIWRAREDLMPSVSVPIIAQKYGLRG